MAEETNAEVVETETVDNPETTEADKTFTQAELNHIVQERVQRAVANAEKEAEDKIKQAQSEGERLAKMTKDERAKEEEAKRLADIEAREKQSQLKNYALKHKVFCQMKVYQLNFLMWSWQILQKLLKTTLQVFERYLMKLLKSA